MTNKELTIEEVDRIVYEEIADKSLQQYCKVSVTYYAYNRNKYEENTYVFTYWVDEIDTYCLNNFINRNEETYTWNIVNYKVINNPIYPHHIMQWCSNNSITCEFYKINSEPSFVFLWLMFSVVITIKWERDITKDYDWQSEETKRAIYNLIMIVRWQKNLNE